MQWFGLCGWAGVIVSSAQSCFNDYRILKDNWGQSKRTFMSSGALRLAL